MRYLLSILLMYFSLAIQGQYTISGTIRSLEAKAVIPNAIVSLEGSAFKTKTSNSGYFEFIAVPQGKYVLLISASSYVSKRLPIILEEPSMNLNLENIYVERAISEEKTENLVTLTETDLSDEEDVVTSAGLLQATRDIYLSRAAFDFSQAFFRVRGYDSRNGTVLLNGIEMNKLVDGRPQWNNWGGLNDITRNQELNYGLQASEHSFGRLLGVTNIDTRPSRQRRGLRLSSSASNRSYTKRLMASYSSGKKKSSLSYALSASRRWAKQGYIEGTFYNAYSLYGSLEYHFGENSGIFLTAILASNKRGRAAAITQEVFEMVGNKYNPYWGYQNGTIRNSREQSIQEPIVLLNSYHKRGRFQMRNGVAYQFGQRSRSRLGYYNAPNPDPTYYRYMPSFYLNSPIGANFINANLAKAGFLRTPQLAWEKLYSANANSFNTQQAPYVLYDDTIEESVFTLASNINLKLSESFGLDFGLKYKHLNAKNYAQIKDLLGASAHLDKDPFSNSRNDLLGPELKEEEEIFNYNYKIGSKIMDGFLQLKVTRDKWDAFVAGYASNTSYFRNGLFRNERFPESSFGKSEVLQFSALGVKGGFGYKISPRHQISLNGLVVGRPPYFQNAFVNPRENNEVVRDLRNEKIESVDINYNLRIPKVMARLSGFYTRFRHGTDINFFFVDSGVGSHFVQEVITNQDRLFMGIETGIRFKVSPAVNLTLAAAIGKYLYANDPAVRINFRSDDIQNSGQDLAADLERIDLGFAAIKNYNLAQGPQKALSMGLDYRDPKYWWIGITANYLANNYASISTITRTRSFLQNPETGTLFPEATRENVARLLQQHRLDNFYLLNIIGGKSWLVKGKYISVFASISNLFDTVFRTGGYEQSRNGNYRQLAQDQLSGSPSFGPKYWYGYGRTYFLNLTISL